MGRGVEHCVAEGEDAAYTAAYYDLDFIFACGGFYDFVGVVHEVVHRESFLRGMVGGRRSPMSNVIIS